MADMLSLVVSIICLNGPFVYPIEPLSLPLTHCSSHWPIVPPIGLLSLPLNHCPSLWTVVSPIDYTTLPCPPVVEALDKDREPLPHLEAVYIMLPTEEVRGRPSIIMKSLIICKGHLMRVFELSLELGISYVFFLLPPSHTHTHTHTHTYRTSPGSLATSSVPGNPAISTTPHMCFSWRVSVV